MDRDMAAIKASPLFAGISEDEAKAMLGCLKAREQSYKKGDFILRAGDNVHEVGLMLSGSAFIIQEDFWGNRNLMARVSPGQIFAESFACAPGSVMSVGAVAENDCTLLWLDVGRVLTLCPNACEHHSHIVMNLLSDLATKNLRFNDKLTHMGKRTTRDKLLSYLSSEAQRAGSPEFDIPFNRQQLADYLSVERSAMSSELGRLRDSGVIDFDRSHFTLHVTGDQ